MASEEQAEAQDAPGPSAADSSIIGEKYATGQWMHSKGQFIPERYPTNKELASAIEQQVSASVETYANYRHVAWYTAFVAIYLLVLYFQVCLQCSARYCWSLTAACIAHASLHVRAGCFLPSR